MRIAYLDCFSGISGDMFLGAILDAGVPAKLLEDTVAALNIGAQLEVSRVVRGGISATKLDVIGQREKVHATHVDHEHKHGHRHEHHHTHDEDSRNHGNASPRGLTEILTIIEKTAGVSQGAKRKASAMFQVLGAAEAKIHNMDIEKVHFHEVGAVDAIVDMVCAAAGAEALGVDEIICSPLNVGSGTVTCEHGNLPVPAPATIELLKDVPIYSSGIPAELVTPTGAAIVKTLVNRFSAFPPMTVDKSGYGAGTRDLESHPNVLRITTGEAASDFASEIEQETIVVLEANLDDLSPQVFGYVMDRLLEEGALDVFCIPVQMKKSRPGMLLTALCRRDNAAELSNLIFAETSTLGIRRREEKRQILKRKWESVSTQWGDVRIKVASMNGTIKNYAPEYEDCRRIAAEHKVPLKEVMQEAVQFYSRLTKIR